MKPPADRSRPTIEVMPHISAPIDDHLLLPKPPRPLWEKILKFGVVLALVMGAMGVIFFRASMLR